MAEIKYEVLEKIGVLSEKPTGWKKELNFVSWNGAPGKFDIREWSPEHDKMGKGITLTLEELQQLKDLIEEALE